MYNLTIGKNKHSKIKLTPETKQDLHMWLEFLQKFNGKNFFISDKWFLNKTLNLYTDASRIGYGGYLETDWFYGRWTTPVTNLDITTLELYPILVAINLWGKRLCNLNIIIITDNKSLVSIINNQTVKNNNTCLTLLRKFVLSCLKFNILIRASHIYGKFNTLSDHLSRSQVSQFQLLAPEMSPEPCPVPTCLLLERLLRT